jgi:hypothetical protein
LKKEEGIRKKEKVVLRCGFKPQIKTSNPDWDGVLNIHMKKLDIESLLPSYFQLLPSWIKINLNYKRHQSLWQLIII